MEKVDAMNVRGALTADKLRRWQMSIKSTLRSKTQLQKAKERCRVVREW